MTPILEDLDDSVDKVQLIKKVQRAVKKRRDYHRKNWSIHKEPCSLIYGGSLPGTDSDSSLGTFPPLPVQSIRQSLRHSLTHSLTQQKLDSETEEEEEDEGEEEEEDEEEEEEEADGTLIPPNYWYLLIHWYLLTRSRSK